jgi:hypothetical protein
MRTSVLSLFLLAALSACYTARIPPTCLTPEAERAFAAALTRMCDVDRQAGLSTEGDPLALGTQRTAWITEHVPNPEVIELRVLMSVKGAPEQATMLRDRARELGVKACPLAETLAKTGEGGLSP